MFLNFNGRAALATPPARPRSTRLHDTAPAYTHRTRERGRTMKMLTVPGLPVRLLGPNNRDRDTGRHKDGEHRDGANQTLSSSAAPKVTVIHVSSCSTLSTGR